MSAEVFGDVLFGVFEVVFADFVRDQFAVFTDHPQQAHRQGSGASAGFEYAGTWEDVTFDEDLGGVFGVDHCGAAWHGQYVVDHEVAEA